MPPSHGPRIAIVGAGPAGLAALSALARAGFDVTCFETGDRPGGLWVYESSSGRSGAYRSLHTNTSRARTEFEDFPMPVHYPDFPSNVQVAEWLDAYVDHFGVRDRIRFGTNVEHAGREAGGGWTLNLEPGGDEHFDGLVVASGHNWEPRWPEPAYPGEFRGSQIHAHDYRESGVFEGKRVLVVGMGNSAMDIAVEASSVAERTFLSSRKGTYVVPKYLLGKPADQMTSPTAARLPWRIRQPVSHFLLRIAVGRPEKYGLQPPHTGLLQDHPTISDTILHRLTHGEVLPKRGIESLDGERVLFADGSSEEVDVIVWCTGYRVTIPFLEPAFLGQPPDELPLYKRIFPLDIDDLFFVGLLQSTGSALPIVEQQGKLLAEFLRGEYALPSRTARGSDIARARAAAEKRYGTTKRPALRVEFDGYMREIRRERERGRSRAGSQGVTPPVIGRKTAESQVAA